MIVWAFISLSYCWWGGPHYAIAKIAENNLSMVERNYITNLFSLWESENGTFSSVASWQDELKGQGSRMFIMGSWHFRNEPVFVPPFHLDDFPHAYNVSSILQDLLDCIYNKDTKSVWALSFAFRSIIHFLADAHTPLHAAGRWSSDFPTGDVGGNLQYLNCKFGSPCKNLHMMWDSAVLDFQDYPIPDNLVATFNNNISQLLNKYPASLFGSRADSLDPNDWLKDGYDVAVGYSYGLLPNGKNPDINNNYVTQGAAQAKKLISVAGYRLIKVFRKYFDDIGVISLYTSEVTSREVLIWVLDSIFLIVSIVYYFIAIKKVPMFGFNSPLLEKSESSLSAISGNKY